VPDYSKHYAELGITPEQLSTVPQISHLLKRLKSNLPGIWTRRHFIEMLKGSEEPDLKQFVSFYESCSKQLRKSAIPIEAICIAAKVDPSKLLGLAIAEANKQSYQLSSLIAAIKHPEIVARSASQALEPDYIDDRMAQLKHSGFIPIPKGSQINVYNTASALAQAQSVSTDAPAAEDTIKRLGDRFNTRSIPGVSIDQLNEGE
jgi:hypothetical protein